MVATVNVTQVLENSISYLGRVIAVEGTIVFGINGLCLAAPGDAQIPDVASRGILLKQPGLKRRLGGWVTAGVQPAVARDSLVIGRVVKSQRSYFPLMMDEITKVAHIHNGVQVCEVNFRGIDSFTPEEMREIEETFRDLDERDRVVKGLQEIKEWW